MCIWLFAVNCAWNWPIWENHRAAKLIQWEHPKHKSVKQLLILIQNLLLYHTINSLYGRVHLDFPLLIDPWQMSQIPEIARFFGVFGIFSEILPLVSQNKASYGANCSIYVIMDLKLLLWCQENSFWATFVFLYRLTVGIGSKVAVGAFNSKFRKTQFLHKSMILMA